MIKMSLQPSPEPGHHHLYCLFVKLFSVPMCFSISVYVHRQAHISANKVHARLARKLGQEVLGSDFAETEGLVHLEIPFQVLDT